MCSPDTAERLIQKLLQAGEGLPAFTSWLCEGHGDDFASASVVEQVRGSVRRRMIAIIIPRDRLERLLQRVAGVANDKHCSYWVEAVESFGQLQRLGGASPLQAASTSPRPTVAEE